METEHALFTHFALNQVFSFQTPTVEVDVKSRNQESASEPSREIEEEIANLLIEFKNQDPSTSPKRKSPSSSPLRFETPSSPTMPSPATTPTQKRRKTSSKSYQTSEVSGSDVEEPYSDDGSIHTLRHFKSSHGEDSEFEYEEDGYGSADHEEYFEEDDDDWLDGRKSAISVQDSTSPTTGRLIRKKAPSGSACEKHKRWKKRCPDDCPMRSSKQQRKRRVTESQFSENTVSSEDSRLSEIEQQDIIQNLYIFVQQASATSPPSTADCLSLIRWSLQQLAAKNLVSVSEFSSLEASLLRKLSTSETDSTSVRSRRTRVFKPEEQIYSEYDLSSSRVALSSMACEKHTALHARCPPNCPERRPVEAIVRRKKATKGDDSSDKEYTAKSPKPKSTKSKGRTGRKYLPQACDRHKLLHAKCPANCPDRIKRDAEAAKVRSPMEISATA